MIAVFLVSPFALATLNISSRGNRASFLIELVERDRRERERQKERRADMGEQTEGEA